MTYKRMDLLVFRTARLLRLVKAVRPIKLTGRPAWALLIEGRGFERLLEDQLLDAPELHRPVAGRFPRAKRFYTQADAIRYAKRMDLMR